MKTWIALLGCLALPCLAATINVQVGPRPFYLVEQMDPSPLQTQLLACANKPLAPTAFSIGHRGAPLQFPEHTREGYVAAARMGAGVLECDVTFTADAQLVCRHAQCDLHATTDVLTRPELRGKCSRPPSFDAQGRLTNGPEVSCCATDFSLKEFKSLCGKMEGSNPKATSIEGYLAGNPAYRSDLYATCGTVLSHAESVRLFAELGVGFTPELKGVDRDRQGNTIVSNQGFGSSGLTPTTYADKLIAEYRAQDVAPAKVWPQSFNLDDVQHWLTHHPQFASQAVYLIGRPEPPDFAALRRDGVRVLGVPIALLLTSDPDGNLKASEFARGAAAADLDLIAWTAERSGRMREDVLQQNGGFYYATVVEAIRNDGAVMEILHALANQVGVRGVFSDWPGTVTYYANCLGY